MWHEMDGFAYRAQVEHRGMGQPIEGMDYGADMKRWGWVPLMAGGLVLIAVACFW